MTWRIAGVAALTVAGLCAVTAYVPIHWFDECINTGQRQYYTFQKSDSYFVWNWDRGYIEHPLQRACSP